MYRSGAVASSGAGENRPCEAPAAIRNAAPTAGSRAAYPGNGVALENQTAAATTAASPSQPSGASHRRSSLGSAIASAAPSASSQARAKVEKYASTGALRVSRIDQASDATAAAATTASKVPRRSAKRQMTTASTLGQTR